jgi:predicted ATPase/DNA-binding CsgD family transcriptional regulator
LADEPNIGQMDDLSARRAWDHDRRTMATLALLITRQEPPAEAGSDTLDTVAAAHGGVRVVYEERGAARWAFPDAAAGVVAALEMRRAALAEPWRLWAAVHAADPTTMQPGGRIWPVFESPEPRAAPALRPRTHNLPEPATSFIGREAEIAACVESLSVNQLVTLTGAGGCGKTRLALEVASQTAVLYEDGAWWVDLAPVNDPALVAAVSGRALGLWLEGEADTAGALVASLADRKLLVVLDNCEHQLGACRSLVTRLVAGCPGVRVLATSREAIGAPGEIARVIPSLEVPDREDQIATSESGRLFMERARSVRPNFGISADNAADVLEICRRVDGIPLAIELAAARTRLLTPRQIATGLGQGFQLLGAAETSLPRQQTLEASVAWSYGLCGDAERILLGRLAVFVGGFTLEAAQATCDREPLDRNAVLDLLDRLIDRSMVALDDSGSDRRYRLLETVRVFARQRLVESGEHDDLRDRHLEHFCKLAEAAEAAIPRTGGLSWLPRLEDDYSNLLAALNWAQARRDADSLLRLSSSLALFWEMRGRFGDGATWMDRALVLAEQLPNQSSALRVRALWGRAHLAIFAGDFAKAMSITPAALALADKIGDPIASGRLRTTLAVALCYTDPRSAGAVLKESIAIGESAGDDWVVADATKFTGVAHMMAGELDAFEAALIELRQVATRLGNAFFLSWCDGGLGYSLLLRGRMREAVERFDHSIAVSSEVGDPGTRGLVEAWRAYALARLGDSDACRVQASACLNRTVRQGGGLGGPLARVALGVADLWDGKVESAAAALAEVAEWCKGGDTLSALMAMPIAGQALVEAGRLDEAAAILAEARRIAGPPIENEWTAGLALYGEGLLAAALNDAAQSEHLLHQALSIQHRRGFLADLVPTFDELANLAARAQSGTEAARLMGAADVLGGNIGLVRSAPRQSARDAAEAAVREQIGGPAFEAAYAEGSRLSFDEVVAYAARARGARGRPMRGWESLTPTELRVVACVAEGLTNPQIAKKLFMSRPTVKTHLTHVFNKLDVSTRSELAAAAARRGATRA